MYLCKKKMGRILAIDYGRKRVGLAVTDELQIIAGGLATVRVNDVIPFLKAYCQKESVECFVVGEPFDMLYRPSEASKYIEPFIKHLSKQFPDIPVERTDERFTSQMAIQTIREAGLKKKVRQNKALVDTVSATLILQHYLEKRLKSKGV